MKTCNCGNQAVVRKHGDWICERCDKLEHSPMVHKMAGTPDNQSGHTQKDWDTYWTGDLTPIVTGESLRVLERMLSHV